MPTPSSGRRAHERFDVVGALWGVLELPQPARIINVSSSGALIDAPVNPVMNSVQTLRLLVMGEYVTVDAEVRHARPWGAGRFLIGLEFVAPPVTVLSTIEQLGAGLHVDLFDTGAPRS